MNGIAMFLPVAAGQFYLVSNCLTANRLSKHVDDLTEQLLPLPLFFMSLPFFTDKDAYTIYSTRVLSEKKMLVATKM
jgi:hypothetical protein